MKKVLAFFVVFVIFGPITVPLTAMILGVILFMWAIAQVGDSIAHWLEEK